MRHKKKITLEIMTTRTVQDLECIIAEAISHGTDRREYRVDGNYPGHVKRTHLNHLEDERYVLIMEIGRDDR